MQFVEEGTQSACRKAEMFNEYFNSVFVPKIDYKLNNILVSNASLIYTIIAKAKLRSIVSDLDVSKTRGPRDYIPSFFVNSGKGKIPVLLAEKLKRLRKIPKCWKCVFVLPIHKRGKKFLGGL